MNEPRPFHIGFALNDTRAIVWSLMEQGAMDQARQAGVKLSVRAARNPEEQANAIHRLMDQHIDLLITAPINYQLTENLEALGRVQAARIPIVTCNAGLSNPDLARCNVSANLSAAAELVAAHLIERLGGRGKILQIIGMADDPRTAGFRQAASRYPDVTLLECVTDWAPQQAAEGMRATLAAHPDLGAVFAHNDWMALEAGTVVAEAGRRGQILMAGFDASPPALQSIFLGHLHATVNIGAARTGQVAVETALRLLRGEPVPPHVETPTTLVTRANLQSVVLEDLAVLPRVVYALTESSAIQRQLQEEIIAGQQRLIRAISTPVIPISDAILVLPLVGTIDSARAQHILDVMLQAITDHQAEVLIMDITGVPVVDTGVAHHLLQATQAARMLGASVILVGITPEVAQTLVQLGVDFSSITTQSTLRAGLKLAQARLRQRHGRQAAGASALGLV